MRGLNVLAAIALLCCATTSRVRGDSNEWATSLIGTWTLQSIYEEDDFGQDMDRWGDTPTGHFVLDATGHFMLQLLARDAIRLGVSLQSCEAKAYQGLAYAGHAAVGSEHTITLTIDDALSNAFDHSRRTASGSITGDQLDLVSSAEMSLTGAFYSHTRWKRVH